MKTFENLCGISASSYETVKEIANAVRQAENQHIKYDNTGGAFLPLVVEIVDRSGQFELISFAHYGECNGDLMRDPEIVLLHDTEHGAAYPMGYRNDWVGIDTECLRVNPYTLEPQQVARQRQKETADFFDIWCVNFKAQQGI